MNQKTHINALQESGVNRVIPDEKEPSENQYPHPNSPPRFVHKTLFSPEPKHNAWLLLENGLRNSINRSCLSNSGGLFRSSLSHSLFVKVRDPRLLESGNSIKDMLLIKPSIHPLNAPSPSSSLNSSLVIAIQKNKLSSIPGPKS